VRKELVLVEMMRSIYITNKVLPKSGILFSSLRELLFNSKLLFDSIFGYKFMKYLVLKPSNFNYIQLLIYYNLIIYYQYICIYYMINNILR